MGSCGREVPYETQFMLLEGPSDNYTVLLPVIDGAFRACLQGNVENELQLCVESGECCLAFFKRLMLFLFVSGMDLLISTGKLGIHLNFFFLMFFSVLVSD